MTAPATTSRGTPTGRRIPDGFSSRIAFSGAPTLGVWERDTKPFSIDGGPLIDITTMLNNTRLTKFPQSLFGYEDGTFVCGFDPDAIATLEAQINVNQAITFWFPDATSWSFYGALIKVEFSEFKKGEFPLATLTIGITNLDSTQATALNEVGPVLTAASGT